MGIHGLISKAIKRINLICREQSINKIIIPRQYLLELFDNELLEISEEDGLPVFKQIVEPQFMLSEISIEYSDNEAMIYNPSVTKEKLLEEEVNFGELKEGAEDHIVKPFSGKDLLKRIKDILDKEGTD